MRFHFVDAVPFVNAVPLHVYCSTLRLRICLMSAASPHSCSSTLNQNAIEPEFSARALEWESNGGRAGSPALF